jgi:hypothetical protein
MFLFETKNRLICLNCREEKCMSSSNTCTNIFTCKCKCATNGIKDITVKCVCLLLGFFMVSLSLYLSSSPSKNSAFMLSILSSACLSMGLYSFLDKSFKNLLQSKRFNIYELSIDACFNFSSGLLAGCVLGIGEQLALKSSNLFQIILIRMATGASVSIVTKSLETFKYQQKEKGILANAFDGALSAFTAYLSVLIGKHFTSLFVKSVINLVMSGLGAGFSSFLIQSLKIKMDKQNQLKLDMNKCLLSFNSNIRKRGVKEVLRLISLWLIVKGEKKLEMSSEKFFDDESRGRVFKDESIYEDNETDDESMANSMMFSLI